MSDDQAFEQRLTREILISERLRATLLAIIPGVVMLLFLAAGAVAPELSRAFQRDRIRVGLFLAGVSAYEFTALRAVEQLIRSGKQSPALRRYANAFIETSLPSVVVLYYMGEVGPLHALLLPPVFTYFVFILLSTLRLDFALSVFTGLCAAVEYVALALFAITTDADASVDPKLSSIPHHLGTAAVLLVSGVAAGFVARRLRVSFVNTLRSVEDKNRIVGVFGQHVSPAVVERLIAEGGGLRSEVREVTVMFVDVRNFTAMSENKTPEQVVDYLNTAFAFMIESVNEHHGIVNKFLGDGFMAIFGAPIAEENHSRDAIQAGLSILSRLDVEVREGRLAPTRLGIGLHAGQVVIGNVGSRLRKEYTVIGDVVNVASRVEALNKELGSQLLVTEEVWEAAAIDGAEAIARAPLTVRGRKAPIRIYELA
jgi:adenylate cyclase